MEAIKVSIVVTVFNESKSITSLLRSLKKQSIRPDEIVVVDGGSTDSTTSKIKTFAKKNPKLKVHLIEETGNIAHGRNIGVREAIYPYIAMTDAGCIALPEWLKSLTTPFIKSRHILVAGFYEMKSTSALQSALAPFLGVTERKFDPRSFLPSARSMAFHKSVWDKIGGFDEELSSAGEDTLFNYEIIKNKIPIIRVPSAKVQWVVPDTVKLGMKKFYSYAKGDAETGIWWHPAKQLCTHNIKVFTIFARYLIFATLFFTSFYSHILFLLFIVAVVLYAFWSIWKLKEDISETKALLLSPLIQIISDFCIMSGFISGITASLRKNV